MTAGMRKDRNVTYKNNHAMSGPRPFGSSEVASQEGRERHCSDDDQQ